MKTNIVPKKLPADNEQISLSLNPFKAGGFRKKKLFEPPVRLNLTGDICVLTFFFNCKGLYVLSSGTGSFDAKILASMSATERQRQVKS